jgi:predicted site-specific integrase-resolvase
MPTGSSLDDRPIQGISGGEAAEIPGVRSEVSVYRLVSAGVIPKSRKHARFGLDREDVERVSLTRYRRAGHPYWRNGAEAAERLGVTRKWVTELAKQGRLPVVEHEGSRFYRRHPIAVIANARTTSPDETGPPAGGLVDSDSR